MKRILLMALAGLTIACGNNISANNSSADSTTDTTATTGGEPSLREVTSFSTSYHTDQNGQVDALILTAQVDVDKQQFTFNFNWPKDKELLGECGHIEEPDLNFDGNPDLLVTLGDFGVNPGLFPTVFYGVLVWNESTGKFEQVKELEDKANLTIDSERKLIISEYATVVGDEYHQEYAWENGKLKLMKETHTNAYDDEE